PLLILHGGPGTPHDYLEPLEALADERPIIFYDQLGCGKSERPDDVNLWFSERFVEELGQIREALGLKQVHIFGHSWGSMLAVDYALTRPEGLVSLILASPPLCIARWLQDAADYRSRLPLEVQNILDRHEAAGTTDSEDYQWATMEYYRRHICRLKPWPDSLERARAAEGTVVYQTMWGPTEFFMTGNLLNYDRTARLHEINVPTLFTCGRYDEATPEATAWYQSFIPGSEMVCFEHSAHMPHLEETKGYLRVVRGFLDRVEQR
ncbi:MAG TPA: proline iminopeptidase-family hydrolase, partial [Ktedonobacteraceae bacterium]|nr:proline iminopeptidase-family hydrolase [Ktedonobacteraceae bacterium]